MFQQYLVLLLKCKNDSFCVHASIHQHLSGIIDDKTYVLPASCSMPIWALFFWLFGAYTLKPKAIPSRMPSRSLRRAAFYAEGAFAIWHVFKNAFATAFADLFLASFRTWYQKKFAKRSFYCKTWNLEPWTSLANAWSTARLRQRKRQQTSNYRNILILNLHQIKLRI